jgi:hypothetical protein
MRESIGIQSSSPGEEKREPEKCSFKSTLSFRPYSNRVPAVVTQAVAIKLPLASKTCTAELVAYSSPLAPSSSAEVMSLDPINAPLTS